METRGSPGFCELSIRLADEGIENVVVKNVVTVVSIIFPCSYIV